MKKLNGLTPKAAAVLGVLASQPPSLAANSSESGITPTAEAAHYYSYYHDFGDNLDPFACVAELRSQACYETASDAKKLSAQMRDEQANIQEQCRKLLMPAESPAIIETIRAKRLADDTEETRRVCWQEVEDLLTPEIKARVDESMRKWLAERTKNREK